MSSSATIRGLSAPCAAAWLALAPGLASAAEEAKPDAEPAAPRKKEAKDDEGGTGLVLQVSGGGKKWDDPQVWGASFGGGVRFVGHGKVFRSDFGLELRRAANEATLEGGFDTSQKELGGGFDAWLGFGVDRVSILGGLGLHVISVSGELAGIGKTYPYDAGTGLVAAPGLGVAVELDGLRPAVRVTWPFDLSTDSENVRGGDASGMMILAELGYEVTRW